MAGFEDFVAAPAEGEEPFQKPSSGARPATAWDAFTDKRPKAVRELPTMSPEDFAAVAEKRLSEPPPMKFTDFLKTVAMPVINPAEFGKTIEEGGLLSLTQAAKRGVFKQAWGDLIKKKSQEMRHVLTADGLSELADAVKADPYRAGAELVKGVYADPELLAAPELLGGHLARALGVIGSKAGPVAAKVATQLGHATEYAGTGGLAVGAIEAAKMLNNLGYIDVNGLVGPAEMGILGGGMLGVFAGKPAAPRQAPPKAPADWVVNSRGDVMRPDGSAPAPAELRTVFENDKGFVDWLDEGAKIEASTPKPRIKLKVPKEVLAAGGVAGAATLYATNPELFEDAGGAGVAMAALGVKPRGGMWHPGAAKRLAEEIIPKLITPEMRADPVIGRLPERDTPVAKWAESRISRYLNKWAGTADDPLRELVLPSGKTWGEAVDSLISKQPAKKVKEEAYSADQKALEGPLGRVPDEELIYDLYTRVAYRVGGVGAAVPANAAAEVKNFVSHMGDYARQNIDPAKLPQYDFVRLARETSLNDARVAKEMEKARSASTAQLPVHKEYPGGMKWVELKLPEKLTPEQARGVRKITPKEKQEFETNEGIEALQFDAAQSYRRMKYLAVDEKGKPLVNSYTHDVTGGATPEEAWLAGRLAEEGNTMGHCVGGYCEGVASGESKIYSLRDAKGESHVTVETAQDFDATGTTVRDNILQIKGKQNRAPDQRYLPYVQDFVKGGKWGEVRDLGNTGLHRVDAEGNGLTGTSAYTTHAAAQGKFKPAPGFHTREELDAAALRTYSLPEFLKAVEASHPSVAVDLREHVNGAVTLANIALKDTSQGDIRPGGVSPSKKMTAGQARGQAAIADIASWADANGRGMMLVAAPVEGGPPLAKLVEIYKRFGFQEGADQPFPDLVRRMYRNPKGAGDAAGATEAAAKDAGGSGQVPGRGEAGLVRPGEEGQVDTRLLVKASALTGGALIGSQLTGDNPLKGAIEGAIAGGILTAASPAGLMKVYRYFTAADTRVRISDQVKAWDGFKELQRLWTWQTTINAREKLPADRLEVVHNALENPKYAAQLTAEERQVADYFRQGYAQFKQLGLQSGVMKDALDNYATHLFVWGGQTKSFVEEALSRYRKASVTSPFAKPRTGPPTLEEAKAAGLKPITENAADVFDIYSYSMTKAIATKKFTDTLRTTPHPDLDGVALAFPKQGGAPKDYVAVGDFMVHPDIAPATRFVLDSYNPGVIRRALEMVNFASKRMLVSLSLFHPKALVDAAIGGSNWINPGTPRMLGGMAAGATAGTLLSDNKLAGGTIGAFLGGMLASKVPSYVTGSDALMKQLRTAGAGNEVALLLQNGLKISLEKGATSLEDVGYGESFYRGMKSLEKFADAAVPYGSLPIKASTKLFRLSDKYMWERMHAGQKLNLAMEKMEVLGESNARAHEADPSVPLKSQAELAEIASKFANSVFGGLDWFRVADSFQTKFGRDLAFAATSPGARRVAQLMLFAPDWTVSTTLAMLSAFGKGTGAKGLIRPQELADLHRQYIVRSFLYYGAMGEALNVAFSGHDLWDNQDPTRVDLGDGRTMQLSKHTMESVHWLTMPRQQALNKMSTVLKLPLEVLTGKEYLSVGGHAPEIQSMGGHLLKAITPIGMQQAMEAGNSGGDWQSYAAGMLGAPIYGKTREQRRELRMKQRVQRALEQSRRARGER